MPFHINAAHTCQGRSVGVKMRKRRVKGERLGVGETWRMTFRTKKIVGKHGELWDCLAHII